MNSWDKSDTELGLEMGRFMEISIVIIGKNDMELAKKLIRAGSEHCKFLRQIQVWADFNMPRYWWSEFDTYHFNTKNSCSTMHKLMSKELVLSDFEYNKEDKCIEYVLNLIKEELNAIREDYLIEDSPERKLYHLKRAKMILPESYLQLRTVNANYAELMNIYAQRKNHRLKEEWQNTFCKWCETLPYFKEMCIDLDK